jgi:hypothetical protein
MSTDEAVKKDLKSILRPQSEKIKEKVNKVLDHDLNVRDNVDKIKDKARELARKDINLGFIDRFTRWIYSNEKHLAKLEFIQYVIFIVILFYYNPFNINTKYPAFTKVLILIVAFTYVMLFIFIKIRVEQASDVDLIDPTEQTTLIKFLSVIAFFIFFMMVIKGIIWLLINTRLSRIFHNLFTTFIVIGVLAIVYLFMRKTIDKAKNSKNKSIIKFVLKVIMFLPCLIVDAVEYIKYEYHLAPKPVWILLGMEAGLVGMWFLLPYVFDKIMNFKSEKLLKEPVNLNVETVVGNFNDSTSPNNSLLKLDELYSNKVNQKAEEKIQQEGSGTLDNAPDKKAKYFDPNVPKNKILAWLYNQYKHGISLKIDFSKHPQYSDSKADRFSYKYALSGWFYINPQPPNTNNAYNTYTNILKYGEKVQLQYNGKLNILRVMAAVQSKDNATNTKNTSVEVYKTNDIMYQKWNNIVINYDAGDLDVFLNGLLVGSMSNVVPYMSFDSVVAGATNGIMGGVCNVNYYKDTLSEKNIKMTYKSLRIKNFPYI